jgi:predicted ferric reductase
MRLGVVRLCAVAVTFAHTTNAHLRKQPLRAMPASKGLAQGVRSSMVPERRRILAMLWTIFVVLLVLWLLGVVSSYTLGGFIHLLLVIALVVLIIQLVSGRRPIV